ncbi:hypothetical protein ACWESM_13515 [Nocardia sp. NPDC003999]
MQLDALTSDAVLSAIQEFDDSGREKFLADHGFGKARGYYIEHNGTLYDSKAIAGVAYGNLPGRKPLLPGEFSGGDETVARALRALGFHVAVKAKDANVRTAAKEQTDYWWSGDSSENCWVEIRGLEGIGISLMCPDLRQNGSRDPWYELVSSVRKRDVVYHYSTRESAFVGRSVAAKDAFHDAADGTYSVALTGFSPFGTIVDLAEVRRKADALYAERDRLAMAYEGQKLYLPFQFKQDRSRMAMMSNYFAKLPRSIIDILFDGQALTERTAPVPEIRTGFLQPFKPKADSDYLAAVAASSSRRTRAHETLVNAFAQWLDARGIVPLRNAAIDLGTENPPTIIEAKRVNGRFADAIRAAVGQLYEYRYFEVARDDSGLIFLADEPIPPTWCNYLEDDREIGVIWPEGCGFYLSDLATKFLELDV